MKLVSLISYQYRLCFYLQCLVGEYDCTLQYQVENITEISNICINQVNRTYCEGHCGTTSGVNMDSGKVEGKLMHRHLSTFTKNDKQLNIVKYIINAFFLEFYKSKTLFL